MPAFFVQAFSALQERILNGRKETSLLCKIIKGLVWFFYPQLEVVGAKNLPQEATIIVANHIQMNGPIAAELYCPGKHYTWCAGQMMHIVDVPEYAFQDFWSKNRSGRILFISCCPTSLRLCQCVFSITPIA